MAYLNFFGLILMILIMIPNIIYAAGQKQDETQIEVPRGLSACEQVGRYGCIILILNPWNFTEEVHRNFFIINKCEVP